MTVAVAEEWVERPLRDFVAEARVLLALLLHPSGQVLAQHGFTRAVDVMSACALAAAIHASSGELGKQLEGKPFGALHHAGRERQIFLAPVATKQSRYILLAVFDQQSSLGLVQLYFEEFRTALATAAPAAGPERGPALARDFEGELNRNLAALFGRT
jgi:predicted regulator of Ras-like GTPase activity (Roadblock/LC7/MglB family)